MSSFSRTDNMLTEDEIKRKRAKIHQKMTKNGVTSDLKGGKLDLRYLFELYDKIFFCGQIQRKLDQSNSKLDFTFSNHTKTGGTCSRKGCEWKINIPIKLYQGLFSKGEKNLLANGIWCTSNLDCLQIIFEHELMHFLMQLYEYQDRKPEYSQSKDTFTGHGKLFQCMVFLYFGHTDYKHCLFGGEASTKLKKEDVHVGMNIKYFNTIYRKEIHGRVSKMNPKRVAVQHNDGVVFAVPYSLLELSDKEMVDNSPPKTIPEYEKRNVNDEIKVGDMVRVKWKDGGIRNGKITKKNPSRAKILMDNDGKIWNVYYQNILGKLT